MPTLYDINHLFGSDIEETATGDMASVSGPSRAQQRIIRGLLTVATTVSQSPYPSQPTYGVGLGAKIGGPLDAMAIQAACVAQMKTEASVAQMPAPTATVTSTMAGEVTINISYTDLSGQPQSFSFNLTD